MNLNVVRAALALGALIDATVAILALFFQPLLGPLLDVPTKDPALTTIAGGEFLVVALLYVFLLQDPQRYRQLFWVVALDQLFAAGLAALEIARGEIVSTWKTVGPIPLSLALCVVFVVSALNLRPETNARR